MNELDKKLAEWAGWELKPGNYRVWRHKNAIPVIDEYTYLNHPPVFTESLDAGFKLLVPKLQTKTPGTAMNHVRSISFKMGIGGVCCLIEMSDYSVFTDDKFHKTPALALGRAIEKLIDKEG